MVPLFGAMPRRTRLAVHGENARTAAFRGILDYTKPDLKQTSTINRFILHCPTARGAKGNPRILIRHCRSPESISFFVDERSKKWARVGEISRLCVPTIVEGAPPGAGTPRLALRPGSKSAMNTPIPRLALATPSASPHRGRSRIPCLLPR